MSEEKDTNYQAELEARVKSFNEKLIPLLKEFQLALGATAMLTSDGRIRAIPQVFDDSKSKVEPAVTAADDTGVDEKVTDKKSE